jgi:dCTP deaminase
MAFWRSETMRTRLPNEVLVEPYDDTHVTQCAYELCMGSQVFITSTDDKRKIILEDGESLVIPPGQFALLLTKEIVRVPLDSIAFISMKFGVKRRGLINVSGFHVDPGFRGRLKFSVYNAGSSPITATSGDRLFLIWYATLDAPTADGYGEAGADQNVISSDDQNVMHGDIASPAELKSQLDTLKHQDVHRKWLLGLIASTLVGILTRLMFTGYFAPVPESDLSRIKLEIIEDLKSQQAEVSVQPPAIASSTSDLQINQPEPQEESLEK